MASLPWLVRSIPPRDPANRQVGEFAEGWVASHHISEEYKPGVLRVAGGAVDTVELPGAVFFVVRHTMNPLTVFDDVAACEGGDVWRVIKGPIGVGAQTVHSHPHASSIVTGDLSSRVLVAVRCSTRDV